MGYGAHNGIIHPKNTVIIYSPLRPVKEDIMRNISVILCPYNGNQWETSCRFDIMQDVSQARLEPDIDITRLCGPTSLL